MKRGTGMGGKPNTPASAAERNMILALRSCSVGRDVSDSTGPGALLKLTVAVAIVLGCPGRKTRRGRSRAPASPGDSSLGRPRHSAEGGGRARANPAAAATPTDNGGQFRLGRARLESTPCPPAGRRGRVGVGGPAGGAPARLVGTTGRRPRAGKIAVCWRRHSLHTNVRLAFRCAT